MGSRLGPKGTLSERARRRALEMADDSDLRLRASKTMFGDSTRRTSEVEPPGQGTRDFLSPERY